MKNLLKKLHIMSNQSKNSQGSASSKGNKLNDGLKTPDPERFSQSRSHHNSEHKPLSLSGWLNSVTNRNNPNPSPSTSPPSSSNAMRGERMETLDSVSSGGLDAVLEAARCDSGSNNPKNNPDIEEYQIQLALELSAKEDPEAVQIEAVKQISLGSCPPENTPAEVVAYRYWNYNALGYDDKILDGFYDLYGILTESTSSRMPSLVDLQGVPMSDNISWEAIMVNRAADANLLKLEQKALEMAVKSRSESLNVVGSDVVRKLAALVSDYMGGSVGDPDTMLRAWKSLSYSLKATLGSMVLPLGSLTIGLPRHRALLFKVLADSVGIPCRLVKGQQYTGSDDAAMNFVKIDDGREYIVDLMADPGTLIPSDAAESHIEYDGSFFSTSPLSRDVDSSHLASSSSGFASSFEDHSDSGTLERRYKSRNLTVAGNESDDRGEYLPSANLIIPIKGEEGCEMSDDFRNLFSVKKELAREILSRPIYPYMHARFPSWTEGVSSPDVRRMKVKDVSQYMIDAAKENPQLAQKLHDVLLESGVVAPPNLFSEICSEQLDVSMVEAKPPTEGKEENRRNDETQKVKGRDDLNQPQFLPPLPYHGMHYKGSLCGQLEHQLDLREVTGKPVSSQHEVTPPNYVKNVPVAAAAAAAAVVASSMVVAVAKNNADSILELPVAAAATATAAAVVATTAAVSKQCENLETRAHLPSGAAVFISPMDGTSAGEANAAVYESRGSGDKEHDSSGANLEGERVSDRSEGNDRAKSDVTLDNVADCEIPWEDITLGERIGLGSYGEVYRGDWHGTEVAVKKFLDQSICGESLQEIKSEVRIMKRLRHPNVVLFMGAVTRAPNLSIITEFLPRGSLYRLIHRPNNQLDERRRLRMALDAARGMNYLHNCTPVIVHRDLKSPNLLVDRNWVVKVCDFGLSRMKHSTFLSSRSTAGTAEWMAPEVLRNEPSDEKCDVYSFGVILWELCTLQQPWGGMNPMQVVGAVGFQHRRLDIPDDMDPAIADIIQKCWQTDPKLRPSFAEIMAALKPLQKTLTTAQVPKSRGPMRSSQKSTPSHTP
ncbi:putative serine/threonine-protein kinase SIS8 [Camellia lanceoleosa]|uniref:Serine/threonine-protein kinase SIS8 n=1 Tax=Camellia lanceoleosa TaxID=1840588 RepID=A0ACC0I172_9ERIC|nr:putative serine/threonine-protein kinase SIS8 [Camellia lanceoleosa]